VNVRGTSRLVLRCSEYDYRNASDSGVRAANAGVVRYLAMRLTFSIPPSLPGRLPIGCPWGKARCEGVCARVGERSGAPGATGLARRS